ncbi:MAG: hypothetical protein CSA35_02805 [Dethiosulfovibrio peptidovorans]|nr:MAG: hypothetical protein CSA35_02805 [Dethiosulfovibrio peptidovorans]
MTLDLTGYRRRTRRIRLLRSACLLCLASTLWGLWIWSGSNLSLEEARLWTTVRDAERAVGEWRLRRGSQASHESDPWDLGLIGLEWSPLSTTLGSLPSKRTACHPSWALAALRWFDRLELSPGDSVAVLSSASFPGMLLNVLMAAEYRGLDVSLLVSLGSSTWGCNDPKAPWPLMAQALRRLGFLHVRAQVYTPGGEGETGGGLSPEAWAVMERTASEVGVPLRRCGSKSEVIRWKMSWIRSLDPKAVISIGGSSANMGDDPAILTLSPGIHRPGETEGGDGVIGRALKSGYPVIHLLNLRELADREGIPFDRKPVMWGGGRRSTGGALLGLFLYGAALYGLGRIRFCHDIEND